MVSAYLFYSFIYSFLFNLTDFIVTLPAKSIFKTGRKGEFIYLFDGLTMFIFSPKTKDLQKL